MTFTDKTLFASTSSAQPHVVFWQQENGRYVRQSAPIATLRRISARDGDFSVIRFAEDKAEINVAMSFDDLRRKVKEAADWGEDLDLLPVTGAAFLQQKCAALADVFNYVSKGTRRGNKFDIVLYGNEEQEACADGDVKEIRIPSDEINFFAESDEYDGLTGIDTDDSYYYVDIPLAAMEQFYTHGRREKVEEIDLRPLTDPKGLFQTEDSLLDKIPRRYSRVIKPG